MWGGCLAIAVANSERDVFFVCEKVILTEKKKRAKKIAGALRTDNSSLGESYSAIPQAQYYSTDHKQSHLLKIQKWAYMCIYILPSELVLKNIKSLDKSYLTLYASRLK